MPRRASASAPTWQESEREALQEFLDWRATSFFGRPTELERLKRLCCGSGQDDAQALCLTGEAGTGKSALLVHAAGVSPRAGKADTIVRRFVGELAQALGIPEPIDERTSTDDLRSTFHDLLRRTAATRRVVLLIDALNQFVAGGSPLSWLPTRLPDNLRLLALLVSHEKIGGVLVVQGDGPRALPAYC